MNLKKILAGAVAFVMLANLGTGAVAESGASAFAESGGGYRFRRYSG